MVNVVCVLFVCSLTELMVSCGSFETLAFFFMWVCMLFVLCVYLKPDQCWIFGTYSQVLGSTNSGIGVLAKQ